MALKGRDFISMDDLTADEVGVVLERATDLKRRWQAGDRPALLSGKVLAMLFEKPSLRTRATFEIGMWQLGGHAVYLAPQDVQPGIRESIPDIARNLERWVEGIVARTFAHRTVLELAEYTGVPVINGLSDLEHPCQTLADLLTVWERLGRLRGARIAWVGDGNNVCHSLLLGAAKVGAHLVVATPPPYAPDAGIVRKARAAAAATGARIALGSDPREAVRTAQIICTDAWVSMGQEAEREVRLRAFAGFQVNGQLLASAPADVIVLHDLPAHRGEEISDEVLDGPQAVVFDQAENRLHAQKALLSMLL